MVKGLKELLSLRKWFLLLFTFVIVQFLVQINVINDYLQATIATICINIILAVSLNLITGFTGQFSLGHAGFMSIGAYTCAIILLRVPSTGGFLAGLLSGAVLAALVGFLVGLPTLRLRGDYLAIATLGMSEIIRIIFLNLEITNGAAGLSGIPRFTNWFYLFVFMAGTILLISNFLRSSHGRACISVREDEIAAEAMGINATRYKVTAFTIGAFCAGIAGALYAGYFYFLKPSTFGFLKSIDILVIVVLGKGSLRLCPCCYSAGSDIHLPAGFSDLSMVLYSLMLIIIMIFRPQGLMGSKELSLKMLTGLGRNLLPSRKEGSKWQFLISTS